MYTHRTTHGKHISFHDCTLSKLKCKEGKVVFKFKDGINALGERTEKAKVKLKLTPMETPVCYVYDVKKNKTVRKEWTLEKLKDKLEYGGYTLEFVECYEWKFGKTVHRICWNANCGSRQTRLFINGKENKICVFHGSSKQSRRQAVRLPCFHR